MSSQHLADIQLLGRQFLRRDELLHHVLLLLAPNALTIYDEVPAEAELGEEHCLVLHFDELVLDIQYLFFFLFSVLARFEILERLPARVEQNELLGQLLSLLVLLFDDALHSLNCLKLVSMISVEQQAHVPFIG